MGQKQNSIKKNMQAQYYEQRKQKPVSLGIQLLISIIKTCISRYPAANLYNISY